VVIEICTKHQRGPNLFYVTDLQRPCCGVALTCTSNYNYNRPAVLMQVLIHHSPHICLLSSSPSPETRDAEGPKPEALTEEVARTGIVLMYSSVKYNSILYCILQYSINNINIIHGQRPFGENKNCLRCLRFLLCSCRVQHCAVCDTAAP
jgi:hypothetical protein